eukprot:GHRQ01036818.1.p1 GENE.GHRQ01036818.1~~GHRQ01036818.1.p1  ORF type:complete len:112 (-),score=10.48 GHRQ01036818.1:171-506(-)
MQVTSPVALVAAMTDHVLVLVAGFSTNMTDLNLDLADAADPMFAFYLLAGQHAQQRLHHFQQQLLIVMHSSARSRSHICEALYAWAMGANARQRVCVLCAVAGPARQWADK